MRNTIIKSILILVMAFLALPMMGQDFMNIFFKNGDFRKFYMKNITEITTSKFDANGVQHSNVDYQHITTIYDKYVYSLEDVDSITFTKIDEELAEHNFVTAMPSVFSTISDCETIDDVEKKLDIIKNTEGVADAWSDGHILHVAIAQDEVYSFHFDHDKDLDKDDFVNMANQVKASLPQMKTAIKQDGTRLKVVIANQQHKDKRRDSHKDDYFYPLMNSFSSIDDIDAHYVEEPTIDFFYEHCKNPETAEHLNLYDYDVIFLITHGSYGSEYLYMYNTQQVVKSGIKWHDFATSEDILIVNQVEQPSWKNNYQSFKNWRDESKYKDATDANINYWFFHEGRDNQLVWVAHPMLTETFFRHIVPAETKFSNPNSVFFNLSCQSLMGDEEDTPSFKLAEEFTKRDLGAYIGYDQTNSVGQPAGYHFFMNMLNGMSLKQAIDKLPEEEKHEPKGGNIVADLLIYPQNTENEKLFLSQPITKEITNEEATSDYNESNMVMLTGTATLLDYNVHLIDGIKVGFSLTYNDPVAHTQHINTENVHLLDNNKVEFYVFLENLERNRTYQYCAYTYDGLNYNYGNVNSFKIDKLNELILSTNSVSLNVGQTTTVDITSGSGSYVIESSDEHVATAFVDGSTISVNALNVGESTITVSDKVTGQTATILVTVTGQADTRELMITKTVNKTVYSIYKKTLDENDYRTNPDGWKCYRSELILDIIKDGKTESYVVDNNIYLDKQDSHHGGQQPCMLLDFNKNMIGIFCNPKGSGYNYEMDGYFYSSSMDNVNFSKETVFEGANWGWFPYFRDYGDDNIYLCNFSYGGYFTILAVRENGSWELYYDNDDISPEAAEQIWKRIGSVLVIGNTQDEDVDDRIHTVIPEEIRDEIEEYIPIYDGMNPPNIEDAYFLSPQILIGSSRSFDYIGSEYAYEYQKYSNQDMANNTIDMVRVQGDGIEWAKGSGAFISGTGNNFTIYFIMEGESDGIWTA